MVRAHRHVSSPNPRMVTSQEITVPGESLRDYPSPPRVQSDATMGRYGAGVSVLRKEMFAEDNPTRAVDELGGWVPHIAQS